MEEDSNYGCPERQNNSENSHINIDNIICDTIECFASTAKELWRPKKRTKVEDIATKTTGYTTDQHPERETPKQRL
jgi:hypothetical protein